MADALRARFAAHMKRGLSPRAVGEQVLAASWILNGGNPSAPQA